MIIMLIITYRMPIVHFEKKTLAKWNQIFIESVMKSARIWVNRDKEILWLRSKDRGRNLQNLISLQNRNNIKYSMEYILNKENKKVYTTIQAILLKSKQGSIEKMYNPDRKEEYKCPSIHLKAINNSVSQYNWKIWLNKIDNKNLITILMRENFEKMVEQLIKENIRVDKVIKDGKTIPFKDELFKKLNWKKTQWDKLNNIIMFNKKIIENINKKYTRINEEEEEIEILENTKWNTYKKKILI